MRLLLLQDQMYVPSFGGGNKATRILLEGLVRRGHACAVVAPALAFSIVSAVVMSSTWPNTQ